MGTAPCLTPSRAPDPLPRASSSLPKRHVLQVPVDGALLRRIRLYETAYGYSKTAEFVRDAIEAFLERGNARLVDEARGRQERVEQPQPSLLGEDRRPSTTYL